MYQLKSPLTQDEQQALQGIPHTITRDEDNLAYAVFESPEDLLLGQTIIANVRYGAPSFRQAHIDTDQPA